MHTMAKYQWRFRYPRTSIPIRLAKRYSRAYYIQILCLCAVSILSYRRYISALYIHNINVLTPNGISCNGYQLFEPDVYTDLNFIGDRRPKIERIIHQTWKNRRIPYSFVSNVKSFVKNNPSWKYYLWTDDSARQLIADHYSWLLPLWDGVWYSSRPIRRADALRYVVLYHYGGVYADLDMVNFRSLENAITKHSCIFTPEPYEHAVFRSFSPYLLSNALMLCASKHPFLERLIQNLITTEFYENSVDSTGPGYVTTQFYVHNMLPYPEESFHLHNGRSMDPLIDNSPYINKGGIYPLTHNRSVYIANTRYFIYSLDKSSFPRIIKECANWKTLNYLHKRGCFNARILGLRRERHPFAFTEHQWHMTWFKWNEEGIVYAMIINLISIDIGDIVHDVFIYEGHSSSPG